MIIFTLLDFPNTYTKRPIAKLFRDGKSDYETFASDIKKDANIKDELGELWAILKYVANDKRPLQGENKYKKLKGNFVFPVFEAKSKHLRLYVFFDEGRMIIITGGKKTDQKSDINGIKTILKEYQDFKTKNKNAR